MGVSRAKTGRSRSMLAEILRSFSNVSRASCVLPLRHWMSARFASGCTCAASASFSYGSRGTPAWAKTLKRVPEFPYAHDGVSIACARNRDLIDLLDADDVLLVAPFDSQPATLGGVAYTATYCQKRAKRFVVVWPDGHLGEEWRVSE